VTAPSTSADERFNRLAEAVKGLRTKAADTDVNAVVRLAGPYLVPFGLCVVLLGWYGASQTSRVYLQIPYLISGGLLGVGLMFVGGFAYFSLWITDLMVQNQRQQDETREMADRTLATLERIEGLLESQPANGSRAAKRGSKSRS
jgi:hypothetical protein